MPRRARRAVGTTLGLGDRADPETDRVVQAYHAVTLGHLLSGGLAHPEVVVYTCQLAKGARLAAALALGRNAGLTMPAILRTEFGLADATDTTLTEAAAGDGTGDESADGQDRQEDWVLLSYADTVEAVPTDTPLRMLRGGQRGSTRNGTASSRPRGRASCGHCPGCSSSSARR